MKKIFTIFILFFAFLPNIFAYEIELNLDRNEITIDEYSQIEIKFKTTDENIDLSLLSVDWLENFEIVWQNQSSRFISNVVNINWKLEQKSERIDSLILTLKALETWEFEIWPVFYDWEEIEEKVKIKVTKSKNEVKFWNENWEENEVGTILDPIKKIEWKKLIFSLVLAVLFILIIILVYLVLKNKKPLLLESWEQKEEENLDLENISLETSEKNLENILKKSILKKYGVKIENLEFSEIFAKIKDLKDDERENLSQIILLSQKNKYSLEEIDKNDLLEKIKNFII